MLIIGGLATIGTFAIGMYIAYWLIKEGTKAGIKEANAESNVNNSNNSNNNVKNSENEDEYLSKELLELAYWVFCNAFSFEPSSMIANLILANIDLKEFFSKCKYNAIFRDYIGRIHPKNGDLSFDRFTSYAYDYKELLDKFGYYLSKNKESAKKVIKYLILVRFLHDEKYIKHVMKLKDMLGEEILKKKTLEIRSVVWNTDNFDTNSRIEELINDFTEFVTKYRNEIELPSINDLHPDVKLAAEMWGITDENLFEPEEKQKE